ncbi:transcriptional repressor [Agromyces atrinae]|uniref:Fur family ferric uptake transcriptional regulator n=1 Tax=Agromyces atrinae TaxID=592376 RepID=A0A4V1R2D5_9MICO|nr:Fur family transcriptional regulator [Agromyces atrinae]MCI2957246.1 transcriptional repressor [Agromyces atrinae]NYD67402.1 Fur family ferric uptake transcriptional regulator [Agromyces atrinae]RXZ86776.1 transcriptional repressor [Agromyces atrinae]
MQAELEAQLRGTGLRVTAGRIAVLDALDTLPHTDAERLFRIVSHSVPTTSVQSMHNILSDLTAAGLVRRIEPAGSAALYERRIGDNHHHVVCSRCGAVADVDCAVGEAPCLTPSTTSGFAIQTAEVTFWGICPDCQTVSV